MNSRYSREDYRLYNAVRRFKHERIGSWEVVVHGDFLYVMQRDRVYFTVHGNYWRVDTYGNANKWFVDKMNVCLHGINAGLRMFIDVDGTCGVVTAGGTAFHDVKWFNSFITKRWWKHERYNSK